MNCKIKILLGLLVGLVLALSVILVAVSRCPKQEAKNHNIEAMEISAFNVQSTYKILGLVSSNQTDKATRMLENSAFLELEYIWEIGGAAGISTNSASRETFATVYPGLRRRVSTDRFQDVPRLRTNVMRFVNEMDPIYPPLK